MTQILFSWVGVFGGALTLFSNLEAVLKLADWANVLVTNWKAWTHEFWKWLLGWVGIRIPPELVAPLTFGCFVVLMAISVKFATMRRRGPSSRDIIYASSGPLERLARISTQVILFAIVAACFLGNPFVANGTNSITLNIAIIVILAVAASIAAMLVRYSFSMGDQIWWSATLTTRLLHTVAVLGALIALNEISKLGIDISPAKAHL